MCFAKKLPLGAPLKKGYGFERGEIENSSLDDCTGHWVKIASQSGENCIPLFGPFPYFLRPRAYCTFTPKSCEKVITDSCVPNKGVAK